MPRLSETITRPRTAMPATVPDAAGRLAALSDTGPNPGNLKAWCHVPATTTPTPMPLVVVLHGCTQTAAGYDAGSGWSTLAERHCFAVLYPEQQRSNNPNLCFNWFVPDDVRRGSGEVQSIRNMIAAMIARHAIDPARVFVTGLSAGGAMASAMLATYPEIFAGGAIIAGMPYGAAGTMSQALERMRGRGLADAQTAADAVRHASAHAGRWPSVAVWHGGADTTVAAGNADAIVAQWQVLHGVAREPHHTGDVGGAAHRVWSDATGRVCVEDYRIAGMGHGTPIATVGDTASGSPAAHMLDVGVSSTWHSAARWGLIDPEVVTTPQQPAASARAAEPSAMLAFARGQSTAVHDTIEAVFRATGLLR